MPATDPPPTNPSRIDPAVDKLLALARELAESPLEGINEAAEELAVLGQDRRVIERAIRAAREQAHADPTPTNKQIASLIRRAVELGMSKWDWDDTKPVP
jgi:hypothetical protein